MIENLKNILKNKSLVILGFGREGRSTYKLYRKFFPYSSLAIIDENDALQNEEILKADPNLVFITGKDCMLNIDNYDLTVKSPGIPSHSLPKSLKHTVISSQTDLFLQCFGSQVIGITGTKGKSTTSSLTYHILKNAGINALLVGNIGIPPFDCIDEISPDSVVVMELSSHQLEYVSHSPNIAVLLNIFQEHLDHYESYLDYQLAKLNIGKYQGANDIFIYNYDNEVVKTLVEKQANRNNLLLPFSLHANDEATLQLQGESIVLWQQGNEIELYNTSEGQPLLGHHNLYNIMAAAAACYLKGVSPVLIASGVRSFNGLEHRIEKVGEYGGILWYNDSIATIPEATIEAVKTLQYVDTLILGGFDRGLEYTILYPFLNQSSVSNIIFVGGAGERMMNEFASFGVTGIKFFSATNFNEVVDIAREVTSRGKICLLSPAAASYDMFKNFEERGNIYKKNVRNLNPSHF